MESGWSRSAVSTVVGLLTRKIDSSRDAIIIKLGSMMVIGLGVLFAALKLT